MILNFQKTDILKNHLWLLHLYPPYWFTGIRVKGWVEKYTAIKVTMRLRLHNRNFFGTHFGGSLYAMCDPFFVLIAAANFGDDYVIWDQAASIRFRRPGRGVVTAVFSIEKEQLLAMKNEVDQKGKKSYTLQATVKDEQEKVVAELNKTIYIRRK